ncbi:MAG: TIGR03936 family radical SAM-associated protein [Oscillospiraceae bacterium]
MPRALFQKTGMAAYISHLDLMRLFQRGFKRAGLPLTHTQGFNPRPSVSIALPLSLGVESVCELLDFDLEGETCSCEEIKDRLNQCLTEGVRVLQVYDGGAKIKHLAYLSCDIGLEYDGGIPDGAEQKIEDLFASPEVIVEKKGKNGITEQNVVTMIRGISTEAMNDREILIRATVCCQNPSLNPAQIAAAISKYLPELNPDFVRICRREIYDTNHEIFR